jgi:hypothetical protein
MRLVWKEGYNRDRQVSQQQLESRYYFAVREFSPGRSGCVELRTSCTAWQFLNLSQPPLRRFVLFGTRLRRLAAKSTRPTRAMRRAAGAPIAHLPTQSTPVGCTDTMAQILSVLWGRPVVLRTVFSESTQQCCRSPSNACQSDSPLSAVSQQCPPAMLVPPCLLYGTAVENFPAARFGDLVSAAELQSYERLCSQVISGA